jgi:hypothetical protein
MCPAEVWSGPGGIAGLQAGFSDGSSSTIGSTPANSETRRFWMDANDAFQTLQLEDNGQGAVGGLTLTTDYNQTLVVDSGNSVFPPFQPDLGSGNVAGVHPSTTAIDLQLAHPNPGLLASLGLCSREGCWKSDPWQIGNIPPTCRLEGSPENIFVGCAGLVLWLNAAQTQVTALGFAFYSPLKIVPYSVPPPLPPHPPKPPPRPPPPPAPPPR